MHKIPLNVLPKIAMSADIATAVDAKNGMIVSERDYVSTWLTTVRNIWRLLGGTAHFQGLTNSKSIEEKTGTDFALVVANDFQIKIALIEAKRTYAGFDTMKKASSSAQKHLGVAKGIKMSRFSDEISRQHEIIQNTSSIYIAEAFISLPTDKHVAPHHFRLASHENAFDRINPTPPPPTQAPTKLWTTTDQEDLLISQTKSPRNIEELLQELIACRVGNPIDRLPSPNVGNNHITLLEQVRQHLNNAERHLENKAKAIGKSPRKKPAEKMAILVIEGSGTFGPTSEEKSAHQQA